MPWGGAKHGGWLASKGGRCMRRLGHDLKVRDAQREKLAQALAAKERELGALENRVRAWTRPISGVALCQE